MGRFHKAASLGGKKKLGRLGLFACTENVSLTSVICNIISASTMIAVQEHWGKGRNTACLIGISEKKGCSLHSKMYAKN